MQNIFKSRKLTKDKFTLISSKVVPSSSTCDDSSLSELCCSPPPYKNILLINCLILLTIFHKSLFWAKFSSSCYLSWFPQHQVTKMVLPPPPLDGMPVHHKVTPPSISSGLPDNSPVPIYTPGWREALLVFCPRT